MVFWTSNKVVYLQHWHSWCHMKLLPSQRVLCTPYNPAQCHFMQSHILQVLACLAVTCHLHFWQSDLDLSRATAVTWVWNRYWNKSQHRKLTLEEKILPPLLPGLEPAVNMSFTFNGKWSYGQNVEYHWLGCPVVFSDGHAFYTSIPASGTVSPKTSGTLLLSLPSKADSSHFSWAGLPFAPISLYSVCMRVCVCAHAWACTSCT